MSQNYDFTQLTVAQLKDHIRALKAQGHEIKLGGKKDELVYRLQVIYGQVAAPPQPAPVAAVPQQGYPQMPAAPAGYAPAMVQPVAPAQYAPVQQQYAPVQQQVAPAQYAPVQAGYQMAPLPVGVPQAAKPKPKKPPRNPVDVLKSAVRDADQTLSIALGALLEAYNATAHYPALVEQLAELSETKPVALPVPRTAEGLRALKVADLKKILKARGEKVGGKKDELVHRIMNPTPKQVQGPVTLPPLTQVQGMAPPLAVPGVAQLPPPVAAAPVQPLGAPMETEAPAFPMKTEAPALPLAPASPLAGGVALPTVQPVGAAVPTLPVAPASPLAGGVALPTVQPVGAAVPTLPVAPASPLAGGVALPTVPAAGTAAIPTMEAASPTGVPALPTMGTASPTGVPALPTMEAPTGVPTLPTMEAPTVPILPTMVAASPDNQ